MRLLGKYKNGNYEVKIYDDGTKVRETMEDDFIASFPENFDCKITNQCDIGCIQCHENSTVEGKHGDILNPSFLNTLKPYTEIAIGGGNPLSHPDLVEFLTKLRDKKVIANMTVNQIHFMKDLDTIRFLIENKLINGIGVSLMSATDDFITAIKEFDNLVVHVINGIVSKEQIEALSNNNVKMLILGYKQFRRGRYYYSKASEAIESKKTWLKDNLISFVPKFKIVSFDNLAIEQLEVKRHLTPSQWEEFYMGDDGTKTMYVDLVEQKFARCSIAETRYDLLDTMEDMFKVILGEQK